MRKKVSIARRGTSREKGREKTDKKKRERVSDEGEKRETKYYQMNKLKLVVGMN